MKKFYLTISICCLSFINAFAQCPITVNDATVCMGQSAILTASGATSYVWSNGATTASITVSPINSTPYTVTGTTTGCSSSAVAMVSRFSLPYADFSTAPNPASVGNPVVTFTDLSSFDVTSWSWDFGDGVTLPPGTINNPVHTYPSFQTNYTVTLTVSNAGGCEETVSHDVVIGPLTDIPQIKGNGNIFTISPNPKTTSGETEIIFNYFVNNINIKVFNITGQQILEKTNVSGNHFNIDISNQTSGVYFIETLVDGNLLRQKLVKE